MRENAAPLIGLAAMACLCVAGCLTSSSTPASVVVPKDPTGLAKCRVSKSQASPLVTEWPASEKAHLESMISERVVVVRYSGCEMKILDACKLDGTYSFKRTTLAHDTIEIKNEDDLYAKIPLGAASLEGELQAKGRLAIRTAIAGQMRLDTDVPPLPEGGACKGATHVVSSVSIGAFKLVSGGAVSGKAGVDTPVAGGGVKHASEESTVRSAGDPEACQMTSSDAPSSDCSSPVQVFLVPLEHAQAQPGDEPEPGGEPEVDEPPRPAVSRRKKRDPNEEPPPDKSVELHLTPPTEGERWMLLGRGGELLCELPCVRRVGKNSGMKVQLDADRKEDIKVVKVPADLGYSPGRKVRAVPLAAYNPQVAAWGFYGGIMAAIVGVILVPRYCGSDAEPDSESTCGVGIGLLAGGGLIGTVGGIWWYAARQEEELELTLMDGDSSAGRHDAPAVSVKIGPGFVRGSF